MKIAIAGPGAFGTALAVTLSSTDSQITLCGRDAKAMDTMRSSRSNPRLPDITLPNALNFSADPSACMEQADVILLAVPAQSLQKFLEKHSTKLDGKPLVACCKGVDLNSLTGPAEVISSVVPSATPCILTGPSFAIDIANGLPTALTLACQDAELGAYLQAALTTPTLRLYRSTDVKGAQLGGALKNIMAIACGAAMGAGLGTSARAALMTRGFAEMRRLAETFDADPETLNGLSGLGDLALTCTSDKSRNYRYGFALGAQSEWDESTTVEGAATAKAVAQIAQVNSLDLPISSTVAALVSRDITVETALATLLARPLKEE